MALVVLLVGCHSAQLRGPGPDRPPAVGNPGSRAAEMGTGQNSAARYGWGSAYDPHRPGSLATPGHPYETGAIPPFPWWLPALGTPMGVPPPPVDPSPRR